MHVLYDFIGLPTFQTKKVLVTRNLSQASRCFPLGAWMAVHETRDVQLQTNRCEKQAILRPASHTQSMWPAGKKREIFTSRPSLLS